jgi:hypothetical protein
MTITIRKTSEAALDKVLQDVAKSIESVANDYRPGNWGRVTYKGELAHIDVLITEDACEHFPNGPQSWHEADTDRPE